MLGKSTISFLTGLARNNNKDWFEKHRSDYDLAKDDFRNLVDKVLITHQKLDDDLSPLTVKDCLFRINRDIRFAKDKTPYKTNIAASMSKGGKKSHFAGYYIHIEPGKSFVGGGIWMPMPPETKKIRQEIDYSFAEFGKLLKASSFKSNYPEGLERSAETQLVNIPKGYEKDNPAAEFLKMKSWIATHEMTNEDLTSKDLVKTILSAFKALQPLIKFLNRSLED
ncbi:MAG: DUF2461 domain-containing protein [Chitinophagaceae bacterium]